MTAYNFVFESVVVVPDIKGRTLDAICKEIDNAYEPPLLDNEAFELDATEIVAIGDDGEVFYKYLTDEVPSVFTEPVTISVRNLLATVELPKMTFDELIEYIEDAVMEDSDIDSSVGIVVDELFEVHDKDGKLITK